MSLNAGGMRSWSAGRLTAAAATIVTYLVPPVQSKRAKLTAFEVLVGATAKTLTVMRPLAKTTVSVVAAAGATSLILTRDPGAYAANAVLDGRPVPSVSNNLIAANDYIAVQQPDGLFWVLKPSAVTTNSDGTVTLTVAAVPTGGIKAGAKVYFFGIITDTDPNTGIAHPLFNCPVNGTTALEAVEGSLAESVITGDPLLIHNANATDQSWIERLEGVYGP